MIDRKTSLNQWIAVIQDEYREMPGLQLTRPQVRRLWGISEADCDVVLDVLMKTGFLRVNARGRYAMVD